MLVNLTGMSQGDSEWWEGFTGGVSMWAATFQAIYGKDVSKQPGSLVHMSLDK